MAIKGLTDRDAPRFPRIGFLRKGGPKRKNANGKEIMGLDLEYFRFDSDDAEANAAFVEVYGEKPKQVNVFFPWPTVDQNFQAWKEAYTASALQHRCDGETCVLWLGPDGEYHTDPKPCPGGCKEIGYLSVIIPELGRMAYVTVLTHSINDIMELQSNLEAYELLGGQLRGVPFVLRRIERRISTPDGRGGRARRSKWLMHLETKPEWTRLKLAGMQMDAIPANVRAALPAPAEAKYIIEGYATDKRMAEIDAMSAEEASAMLRANVAKQRGPNWEHFEGFGDEPDGVTEGKFTEQPKPAPQPTNGKQPQDPPAATSSKPWYQEQRPWSTDNVIGAIRYAADKAKNELLANGQWGALIGLLDSKPFDTVARHTLIKAVFGVDSSKDLDGRQRYALHAWAKPAKVDGQWCMDANAVAEYMRIVGLDIAESDNIAADPDGWAEIDAAGVTDAARF